MVHPCLRKSSQVITNSFAKRYIYWFMVMPQICHQFIPQESFPPIHTPRKYVHWFIPPAKQSGLLAAYEMQSNLSNNFTGPCSRKSSQVNTPAKMFTGSCPMRDSQASWLHGTRPPAAAPPPCFRPFRPGCPETAKY